MLDIKMIRDDPDAVEAALAKRGVKPATANLLELDDARREFIAKAQELQTERNALSKKIGQIKGQGGDATEILAKADALKANIGTLEHEAFHANMSFEDELAELPNLPLDDVPEGDDESAAVELRSHGTPRTDEVAAHFETGATLGQMDFETAAKISGARFVILTDTLARLERALGNFMLDVHTGENGYREVVPPLLVNEAAVFGVGQLPKFEEDLFHTEGEGYWLASTSEVMLTNLVRERIVPPEELPLRATAWTPCFRSEAGAAGRDTRGLIRLHQFSKVELVSVVEENEGLDELERMTACAEEILKRLDLPYRVMLLAAGDMGFSARKTYDLEVWLPAQQRYREISSCSYCGDFQARRMNARTRGEGKATHFLHTLNGSGLAVGRTMAALLENHLQEDGTIAIPEALQPYMGGAKRIEAAR